MLNLLNYKRILIAAALMIASFPAFAQENSKPFFTKIKFEARADFNGFADDNQFATATDYRYGLCGQYFNLHVAGNLSEHFSYFFRQRIVAKPGSVTLFDNTDFLWVSYQPTANWRLRAGKDALAVGGFEYDAAPIDVYFFTNYWDNFYCFQPAVSASYISDNGNHTFMAQVSNSPYVHYGANLSTGLGAEWSSGLLGYHLYWSGNMGHFQILYSVNWFQRPDKGFLNYIALGNKVVFDKWNMYVDLIHHSLASDDWGNNFCAVSRLDWNISSNLTFFAKGAYEQNHSDEVIASLGTGGLFDCFVEPHHSYCIYGAGFEYRPKECRDVRLHCYVANRTVEYLGVDPVTNANVDCKDNSLNFNLGVTWDINVLKKLKIN